MGKLKTDTAAIPPAQLRPSPSATRRHPPTPSRVDCIPSHELLPPPPERRMRHSSVKMTGCRSISSGTKKGSCGRALHQQAIHAPLVSPIGYGFGLSDWNPLVVAPAAVESITQVRAPMPPLMSTLNGSPNIPFVRARPPHMLSDLPPAHPEISLPLTPVEPEASPLQTEGGTPEHLLGVADILR